MIVTSGGSHRPRSPRRAAEVAPAGPACPARSARPAGTGVRHQRQPRVQRPDLHPDADRRAARRRCKATGATVARSDAFWEATEPHAPVGGHHHYDWSFDDRIAGSLAAHGLTWLPIIDYAAPWAESVAGQDHSPPRSSADYAAYAGAFAARYGSGGTFWRAHPALTPAPVTAIEIWNEPDNPEFWVPEPDAAGYARLYLDGAGGDRRRQPGDPGARGRPDQRAGLPAGDGAAPSRSCAGHVDGVALHPYGSPAVVLARVRGARAALVSAGMSAVPLYVTEFGWTTRPPGGRRLCACGPAPRRHPERAPGARAPGVRAGGGRALHLGDAGAQRHRRPGLVRHRQPGGPERGHARHPGVRRRAARRGGARTRCRRRPCAT